ncbi:MAG: hypothetical protein RIQ99_1945, partial [Pseudomonadota bacterium]
MASTGNAAADRFMQFWQVGMMKQTFRNHGTSIAGIAMAMAMAFAGQSAHATGVSAGTLIQNTASATYTSGASGGSVQSNTLTVKVDELLDVAVAGITATPVAVGSGTAVLAYSVTNIGNGSEAFRLTADPAVSGNPFNAVVQTVAVDSNGNGTYDSGIDQTLANGGASPAIAADAALRVFVVVTLPTGAADAQTSQIRLTADAVTGTGTPGSSFSGQGQG